MRFLPPTRALRCNTGDIRHSKHRNARLFKKTEKRAGSCQIKIIPRCIRFLPALTVAEGTRVTNRF